MEIIKGIENLTDPYPNTVLTIGNFDGVHLGHRKILSLVLSEAQRIKGTSMVMTFDPHPMKVLAPERNVPLLVTFEEKCRLIEKTGIEVLLCMPFTKDFANMLPDDFIKNILVDRINSKVVIVGSQYKFGRSKKGSIDLLRRRGRKYGFSVHAVRHAKLQGHIVSSSTIRALLMKGAVAEVSKFLGRAYSIKGTVVRGKGRGQEILHIPTANITTPVEIAPKEGVYAVRIRRHGRVYDGVANIGRNPTFGDSDVSYEVHIFDFSGDILGEDLRVFFIDRIRSERTFPGSESLEKQIREDIARAREILKRAHPDL
ncbi:MAG: bifunctional riboflavin kinase/FAD synthetase [Nitrospirota bacterium]